MINTEYKIEGMSCQHCVNAVKKALETLPNVQSVTVTVGAATITSSAPVDKATVSKALADEGYTVVS